MQIDEVQLYPAYHAAILRCLGGSWDSFDRHGVVVQPILSGLAAWPTTKMMFEPSVYQSELVKMPYFHHELDVAPWEAVLGAEVIVPTLDGSIKLRIPAATEDRQQLRVRGKGLPKGKTGERGDFFVTINVVLPTQISDDERKLWEQLRSTSTFKPRA